MQMDTHTAHPWLQRFVGEWRYTVECDIGPHELPVRDRGTESVRSFGFPWVVCEGKSDDGSSLTLTTLGYDAGRQRFVRSSIGSISASVVNVYYGELEPGGTRLVLYRDGSGSSSEDGMPHSRDTIEFLNADRREMTSEFQQTDGSWHTFMTSHYRRVG